MVFCKGGVLTGLFAENVDSYGRISYGPPIADDELHHIPPWLGHNQPRLERLLADECPAPFGPVRRPLKTGFRFGRPDDGTSKGDNSGRFLGKGMRKLDRLAGSDDGHGEV